MSIRRTFFFLVNYAQYTHYSRTIDGQYTHYSRTISALFLILPQRMKIQSPPLHLYTLHLTLRGLSALKVPSFRRGLGEAYLCFLLRLPSLFLLLYFALFHRPTTERRPRELRKKTLRVKKHFS